MLDSLSLISIVPAIAHATYQFARRGEWSLVLNQITAYPAAAHIVDQDRLTSGWTLFDHAIFQKNVFAFNEMRRRLGAYMAPQPRALFPHLRKGDWLYVYELLKEGIIEPSASFIDINGNAYTLLDIALGLGKPAVAEVLRATYGVLTHETMIQQAMFQAAKEKNWELVYQYINEKAQRVDYIDNQITSPSLLLEYAFLQRESDVILTLIDEYHADIELLANVNAALYESVMGMYENAKVLRSMEQLRKAMQSVAIGQVDEVPLNAADAQSKSIILGFESLRSSPSGITLLKQDYPGEDVRLTYRGQRLLYS